MALHRKINKAKYDALSEDIKKEYTQDGDSYTLETVGDEDTGALKRAKDHEKTRREEAERQVLELTSKVETFTASEAQLKSQHTKEIEKLTNESKAQNGKMQAALTESLVHGVARDLAGKISKAPALLLPHIQSRLVADFSGDKPTTKILDKDGKPSAMTLEQLSEEFVSNKDFSAIIVASKASGGAAPANGQGGGAPKTPTQTSQPAADMSKWTPQQLADHITANKAAA